MEKGRGRSGKEGEGEGDKLPESSDPPLASSVLPLMVVLVDDLLHWYDGKMVEDHTRSPDDPDRNFLLRVVLLFWCGDYPGLGEVTNFSHAGYNQCHWCTDRGCHSKGLSRMVYGGYRR